MESEVYELREKLFCLILAIMLGVLAISGCGPYAAGNLLPSEVPPSSPTPLPATQQPVILPTSVAAYNPFVSVSPPSGQPGTLVQVIASGFPPNASVSVAMGPAGSEFIQAAQGMTDSNGAFVAQVVAQGASGMNLLFAVVVEGQPGIVATNLFHITEIIQPIVTIAPTSGETGTLVQVVANGFPPNMAISIGMGPANSEFGEVAQGVTDGNGVFVAHVTAQGSLGMNLVFAASAGGQPAVLSQSQFQITGAVPNPQPISPTPTPYLDMWQDYSNQAYAVSLQYPADWQPIEGYYAPETGDVRFGGINGFFHIGAMDADSIDQATASEAEHVLQPYGSQPIIEVLQIQGQEARLIMPSTDQPSGMQYQAAVIILYPKPVNIFGTSCRYFILWSDWPHIRTIAQTLRFND
jgi:hypothetical protein